MEGEADMDSLLAVWNEWEIRMLVLTSLALQVFLLFFAGIRKRNVSAALSLLLWLAYLLADSIAIYALGYLSQTRVPKAFKRTHRIQALWAPFLLLHLGGQDTITAFSIEDNELWKRHLLSLLTQVRRPPLSEESCAPPTAAVQIRANDASISYRLASPCMSSPSRTPEPTS